MTRFSCAGIAMALSGLAVLSPVAVLAADQPASAKAITLYAAASRDAPQSYRVLGAVRGQVCRKPSETAPTDAEAIASLKASAGALGADSIIGVDFYRRAPGPATKGQFQQACWQSISVSGTAVMTGQVREATN
jgi:uncharacterized protein YbjQ (UPF0145 family)